MTVDPMMMWLTICTFLVLMMQAGFTCIEAGMVRAKNSISVAIKNISDLGISMVGFMVIGHSLMFGAGTMGLWGWDVPLVFGDDPRATQEALFQALFCGTAVTIVSGAVSERMTFRGYVLTAAVTSILIYPIAGHWAWGPGGWLGELGFVDFAGGTVVHGVGGTIALVMVLCIGPRLGRFSTSGHGLDRSNLALAALGAFILMFGWFGFNSGSASGFERQVPQILVTTAIAGAVGIIVWVLYSVLRGRVASAEDIISSMLGGLTATTAGCAFLTPSATAVLAALGGVLAVLGGRWLARRGVDDPVNAIAVHLFAGVAGTVLLPLFAMDGALPDRWGDDPGARLDWMIVQATGCAAILAYAAIGTFLMYRVTRPFLEYRVTPEAEQLGLNIAEHGAQTAMLDLLNQLAAQAATQDFQRPVEVETHTDAGYIATFYNEVRRRFLAEADRARSLLDEARFLADHDPMTGLQNRRAFTAAIDRLQAEPQAKGGGAFILIDADRFKAINDTHGHDTGDAVIVEIGRRLHANARTSDLAARLGGEEFALLLPGVDQAEAERTAERVRRAIADTPMETPNGPLTVTVSIGVAMLQAEAGSLGFTTTFKAADSALYEAKVAGRNRVRVAADTPPEA